MIEVGYQMFFAKHMTAHQCQMKKCKSGKKAEIPVRFMSRYMNYTNFLFHIRSRRNKENKLNELI